MYFTNEEHKENYEKLMAHYRLRPGQDVQYESSIYICAVPELFDCFDSVESIDTGAAPAFELMEWDDEKEKHVPSAPGLTGSTRRMLEFGVSCYTGYEISMDDVLGSVVSEDLFNALIQAMRIRSRK